jgi:CrcB protein
MRTYLFLSIGAVLGAICRYKLGLWMAGTGDGLGFPWGTFTINVTGSFLLGFLMRYMTGIAGPPDLRVMLTTGFCGAYTTFSTFSYETLMLLNEGITGVAVAYVAASLLLAPAGCFAGYMLAGLLL